MKTMIVAVSLVALPFIGGTTVTAAPITCDNGQTVVHDGGDRWSCQNKAGHTNESDKDKNDNHPH